MRISEPTGDGAIAPDSPKELQTIAGYGLPVKVFLLNNNGYVSIFQTHRNFFNEASPGPPHAPCPSLETAGS